MTFKQSEFTHSSLSVGECESLLSSIYSSSSLLLGRSVVDQVDRVLADSSQCMLINSSNSYFSTLCAILY